MFHENIPKLVFFIANYIDSRAQVAVMSEEDGKIREVQTDGARDPETIEQLRKTITIDTIHNDEAMKVLANYVGDEQWTEEEEKKLVRKIDRRLLSILCLTYGLQVDALPLFFCSYQAEDFAHPFEQTLTERPDIVLRQGHAFPSGRPRRPSMGFSFLTYAGPVRSPRRSEAQRWHSILNVGLNLLLGFHSWGLPGNCSGTALSHRAGRVRHRAPVGNMPYLHRGLSQLPEPLCTEVFPWCP